MLTTGRKATKYKFWYFIYSVTLTKGSLKVFCWDSRSYLTYCSWYKQKVNLLVYAQFPQRKEARRIVSHGLHTSILKLWHSHDKFTILHSSKENFSMSPFTWKVNKLFLQFVKLMFVSLTECQDSTITKCCCEGNFTSSVGTITASKVRNKMLKITFFSIL